MIDYEKTIISQFANSPTICALIKGMNDSIDPSADFQTFFDYVWNVDTAQGFGLDIWGKIVGVGRILNIPVDFQSFGFDAASYLNFDRGSFVPDDENRTRAYRLEDEAYRMLILAKAMSNICSTTAPSLNRLLLNLFNSFDFQGVAWNENQLFENRGRCYVNSLGDMHMRYTFEFHLLPYEKAIIENSGVLSRGAGVDVTYIEIIPMYFGFGEVGSPYVTTFDNGNFVW